jgi:peptide/nickel transport system substrate-binding protein
MQRRDLLKYAAGSMALAVPALAKAKELRTLRFSPIVGDAVASIRRCAVREGFSQALLAATGELTAPDDRTIRFRLLRPFRLLPEALAGLGTITPVIMPERLAAADPSRPVTEMIGSGPYRFIASEFVIGERSAYERFADYVPRPGGTLSYTSGSKVAHFDRVEWLTINDAATSASALLRGEVDWLQAVAPDQVSLLARRSEITLDVTEPAGSIGIMRFNHLYPPFDNPAVRRALLGAIDQAEAMQAVAGTDRRYWRDRVGLFPYGTPLATDVGIEVLTGPREYDKVKRELAQAGYRGERVVALGTSGSGYIPALTQVGSDALRRSGMNVDLQLSDFATMARRMVRTDPPDKGGWNVHFIIAEGGFNHNPATNVYLPGDGKSGAPGWPKSPRLEALRLAWLEASDPSEQMRIAEATQRQLWQDVPYIPMGQWLRVTAYRRDLVDVPRGFAAFYGVRRAG